MRTKSLLAWLALGIAVVLSGCSTIENPIDLDNPNTWLTASIISSEASASNAIHVLNVKLTNAGPRAITAASANLTVRDASSATGADPRVTGVLSFRATNEEDGSGTTVINVPAKGSATIFFVIPIRNDTRNNMIATLGGTLAGLGLGSTINAQVEGSTAITTLNARTSWAFSLVDAPTN